MSKATRLPGKSVNSWWPRFWAWLIDVIIIGVVSWVLFPPLGLDMFPRWDMWRWGVNGVVGLIYWTVLDSEGRMSIGKKALGIRQIKVNGKTPDLAEATISAFGKAFLLPIDMIAGVLARPGKKRRLFNIASDTIVVKA